MAKFNEGDVLKHKKENRTVTVLGTKQMDEKDRGYWVEEPAGAKWMLLYAWEEHWERVK